MNRWLYILMGSLLVTLLSACGGSDAGVTSRTGTVALTFTDAPSDDFQHINLDVSGVRLLSDNGQITIFDAVTDGGNRMIDLLALQAFSEYFAVEENVPAGTYNKIRLFIDDIELVKEDENGNVIETIHPDIPANGKIDLNPRGNFVVHPEEILQLQIDIDANKSIHIHQAGNSERYKFRPVVFIDVINDNFRGRLVRIHGMVDSVDTVDNSFVLCPDHALDDDSQDMDDDRHEHCVRVNPENASVFDPAGLPVDAYEYTAGEELTAIGFLVRMDDDDDSVDNNDEYEHRTLNAEVIELGPGENFEIIKGKVASEPASETDQFVLNMRTDPITEVVVQLQAGTKIFNKQGDALDYTSIQLDRYAIADGVFDTTDEGLLNAALVVIDTEEMPSDDMEEVSGEILAVDVDNSIITISTEIGDLEILVGGEHILLIDDSGNDGSLSEAIDLPDVTAGQTIEAYGMMGQDGYFHAEIVLVSDDSNDSN